MGGCFMLKQVDKSSQYNRSQDGSHKSSSNGTMRKKSAVVFPIPSNFPEMLIELAHKIKEQSIAEKIERIVCPGFSPDEMKQIYGLLSAWGKKDVLSTNFSHLIERQFHRYYKQIDVLSARVYQRTIEYVKTIQFHQASAQLPFEDKKLIQILSKNGLNFSYDRFFLEKKDLTRHYQREVKNYWESNKNVGESWTKHQSPLNKEKVIREVYIRIWESKLEQLKKIFNFLLEIQLLVISEDRQTNNCFMQRLERIPKIDQKMLYFQSIQFQFLQEIISLKPAQNHYDNEPVSRLLKMFCPNYYFYNDLIERELHPLFENYKELELRHDYIQWMFPNHYQSAFNSEAKPMNYLQKKLFLSESAGLKMLISIYIFFDFLGIRLSLTDFSLHLLSQERLKAAILVNTHNHLRIMRILACLSITGFRFLALKLITFLDEHTQENGIAAEVREEFIQSWVIYGNDQTGTPTTKAKNMCFLQTEGFPEQNPIIKMLNDCWQQKFKEKIEQQLRLKDESKTISSRPVDRSSRQFIIQTENKIDAQKNQFENLTSNNQKIQNKPVSIIKSNEPLQINLLTNKQDLQQDSIQIKKQCRNDS